MTDTASRRLQTEPPVVGQGWYWQPDASASLEKSPGFRPLMSTVSREGTMSSASPTNQTDWRAELKARYAAMPRAAWFRAAHQGRSLGEGMKIT